MKTHLRPLAAALFVCVLLSTVVLATIKSRNLTFTEDMKVGDTIVRKGTYKLTFDDKTNELTISNDKGVVAKMKAHLEEHDSKSNYIYRTQAEKGNGLVVLSINIGRKDVVINSDRAGGAVPAEAMQK